MISKYTFTMETKTLKMKRKCRLVRHAAKILAWEEFYSLKCLQCYRRQFENRGAKIST